VTTEDAKARKGVTSNAGHRTAVRRRRGKGFAVRRRGGLMHQMIGKRLLMSSLVVAGAAGTVSACTASPPQLPPDQNQVSIAAKAPPAISGGTLVVRSDGLAIASDPDRDQV